MPKYRVTRSGALADGTYRKAGAIITLAAEQAKYYLPPHDDRLEELQSLESVPPQKAQTKPTAKSAADKG